MLQRIASKIAAAIEVPREAKFVGEALSGKPKSGTSRDLYMATWANKPFGYQFGFRTEFTAIGLDPETGALEKFEQHYGQYVASGKPVLRIAVEGAKSLAQKAYISACKLHQKKPSGLGKDGLTPNKVRTVWILPNRNLEILQPEYPAKAGRVCRLAHVFTFGNSIRADRVCIDVETGKAIGGQILSKFNAG